jgi:hypothetical protein
MRSHLIRVLGLAVSAAVAIAVVIAIGLGGSSPKAGHRSSPLSSRPTRTSAEGTLTSRVTAHQLQALAFGDAKRNGDAVPVSMDAVRTTHREAWRLMFPGMPSNVLPADATPVYFIVMTGHFTDRDIGPANTTVTGTQLHLVVDMHGNMLDGGLDHLPAPNLEHVGRVLQLNQ